jgi:hypothetical protein
MKQMLNRSCMAAGLAAAALFIGACTKSEPATPATPETQSAAGLPAAKPAKPEPVYYDELYVDAEAEPDEGPPPLEVKFTSIVEDQTGAVECEWDFGDGSPEVKALHPTHTYAKEGDFIVIIECTDSKGVKGETEIDVSAYDYE